MNQFELEKEYEDNIRKLNKKCESCPYQNLYFVGEGIWCCSHFNSDGGVCDRE